jgi:hypothetical protein
MENDNFIMEFDNFYSKEECEKLITMYERHAEAGLVLNRQEGQGASSTSVDDTQLFSNDLISSLEVNVNSCSWVGEFDRLFWKYAYPPYNKKYGILNGYDPHGNRYMKIQKTKPAQGYHVWHSENMSKIHTTRLLTWILYLNTIEDGGESEWLYLSKRSKAQEGKLVLWPAGFTHTHRGNPPLKETKYIMTGWVEMH